MAYSQQDTIAKIPLKSEPAILRRSERLSCRKDIKIEAMEIEEKKEQKLEQLAEDIPASQPTPRSIMKKKPQISIDSMQEEMPEIRINVCERPSEEKSKYSLGNSPAKMAELIESADATTPQCIITPSNFLRSPFRGPKFFNFGDEATASFNFDGFNSQDLTDTFQRTDSLAYGLLKSDSLNSWKSDYLKYDPFTQNPSPQARSIVLPPFSPMEKFQHSISPR
eukprot:CAMPEP_0202942350 /NCGR_PEP_ID=MMETSP1395-20130829/2518_1 /ASSEMBLY_ACC=CAM_ASM_000871 /TAXON_ID=5961 /ORGANISM="Blepharisma japonicum, Strain Stock R1072" /LENGTH=222 /DNA_ID=CAMNT_0049638475 /DNA_START=413 /DNA_END=1077 /DNA_ORIENTATION=+